MALWHVNKKDIIFANYKFNKEYVIEFNTNSLPIDWNNWIVLNEKSINLKMDSKGYYCLDSFKFVVVDSLNENFEFIIGGVSHLFEKGCKHIPIFGGIHSVRIRIKKGLKIFYNPDEYLIDFDKDNSFWYFLCNFCVIYKNLQSYNTNGKQLIKHHGIYGYCKILNYVSLSSVDSFYYNFININKIDSFENVIYYIDQFIQYDIIKIYETNKLTIEL